MLNNTAKKIVYLDDETLRYMYYNYTGERAYPVMKKLYTLLNDGFLNDWLVTPLSVDHVNSYIDDNKLDQNFLKMMGTIGQVQFHQRFTIKTLQLVRILNHFYSRKFEKPIFRDAFSNDPDERYHTGFNRYNSITTKVVQQALVREKNFSQIFEYLQNFQKGASNAEIAVAHFRTIFEQFSDLIRPNLPSVGSPETHINKFLQAEEIRDIPEFHILSSILNPLFETYGIEAVEQGLRDNELLAAESISSYLPYCHYYVTKVDIAEIISMSDIRETYLVKVYDDNESSLYRLIQDITSDHQFNQEQKQTTARRTMFQKGGQKL